MSVSKDDIWEMWALWHWQSGIVGPVFGTRREARRHAIEHHFGDVVEYGSMCGKGRPYKIVKVDVTWAK